MRGAEKSGTNAGPWKHKCPRNIKTRELNLVILAHRRQLSAAGIIIVSENHEQLLHRPQDAERSGRE